MIFSRRAEGLVMSECLALPALPCVLLLLLSLAHTSSAGTIDTLKTTSYPYVGGRIIFIPIGAILFLILVCIRQCLSCSKEPSNTVVAVIRRTVIIPVEVPPTTAESTDQPPSYTDVQKEDLPPAYAEVIENAADQPVPETTGPFTSPAQETMDPPAYPGTEVANSSAPVVAPDATDFTGRPKFLTSQYSYKRLE